jgi:protein-disulfide isomerase
VTGIFFVSGATKSIPISEVPRRLFRDVAVEFRDPAALAAALVVVGVSGGLAAYFPKEGSRPVGKPIESTDDFAEAWFKQPRIDLGIPADGAKVVIVKFNDFQCPSCRVTHEWYKPVLEKFEQTNPGAVRYVLKDWPWNTKCNPSGQTLHPGACEAAVAVRVARAQSKAKEDEMTDWLFAHQQPPATPEEIKKIAKTILGDIDFDAQYQQLLPAIRRDVSDGVALRVSGTPTYFINGVRLNQTMPPPYFELAIQLEINKAAGK